MCAHSVGARAHARVTITRFPLLEFGAQLHGGRRAAAAVPAFVYTLGHFTYYVFLIYMICVCIAFHVFSLAPNAELVCKDLRLQ